MSIDSVFGPHLARWQAVADGAAFETHTSHLLPVLAEGRAAFLKVFKSNSDETGSGAILRRFAGVGVVDVLQGDETALVLERVGPGTLLDDFDALGDHNGLQATLDVVARIHSHDPPCIAEAMALRQWFSALFEHASDSAIHGRCAACAATLLNAPHAERLLHGDIHHGNILKSSRGWLAIDPKGLWGERAYEIANLLGNPLARPEVFLDRGRMVWLAQESAVRLGLDVRRVLQYAFAFAGLSASWPGSDDDPEPAIRLRSAAILEDILARGQY